jgi:hypothetical protein
MGETKAWVESGKTTTSKPGLLAAWQSSTGVTSSLSIQLTAKHKVSTPVNWKQGEDVIISGSVSDDEAKTLFPAGWSAPKPYMRYVKQPG